VEGEEKKICGGEEQDEGSGVREGKCVSGKKCKELMEKEERNIVLVAH